MLMLSQIGSAPSESRPTEQSFDAPSSDTSEDMYEGWRGWPKEGRSGACESGSQLASGSSSARTVSTRERHSACGSARPSRSSSSAYSRPCDSGSGGSEAASALPPSPAAPLRLLMLRRYAFSSGGSMWNELRTTRGVAMCCHET